MNKHRASVLGLAVWNFGIGLDMIARGNHWIAFFCFFVVGSAVGVGLWDWRKDV